MERERADAPWKPIPLELPLEGPPDYRSWPPQRTPDPPGDADADGDDRPGSTVIVIDLA